MNVLFRHVGRPVAKRGRQCALIFFKNICDRQAGERNAEILGQRSGVALAACRRKRSWHGDAEYVFGSQGIHRDGSNDSRINAATQADQNFLETAFTHVVRRAGQQCLVGIRDFCRRLFVNLSLPRGGVKEYEILFERQRLCGHAPIGGNRHACAIKNQIVVAANLVDIYHGSLLLDGNGTQHLKAEVSLVDRVG